MSRQRGPRLKKCAACCHYVPWLVRDECSECAGLTPLPLRMANGRFLSVAQVGTPARR